MNPRLQSLRFKKTAASRISLSTKLKIGKFYFLLSHRTGEAEERRQRMRRGGRRSRDRGKPYNPHTDGVE